MVGWLPAVVVVVVVKTVSAVAVSVASGSAKSEDAQCSHSSSGKECLPVSVALGSCSGLAHLSSNS